MKRTIIYFTGVYDTLDLFTEELKTAFEHMGYASFVYDARSEAESKRGLLSLAAQKKDTGQLVGVTFNNLGYNLDLPDGSSFWETYEIPYLNILMDHPFHYEKPLRSAPSTSIVLCTDRNHVKYIRRFYKNVKKTEFLPHAGAEPLGRRKPLAERGIDVLYAGALPVYTVGRMIPNLKAVPEVDGETMAAEVLEELVRHPYRTTEEVIEEYLRAQSADIPEERIHVITVTMRFLDSYATSFFREQAVRILVENGICVTAYGTGWDQCEWSGNPCLKYGGKILAPQVLPLMRDSKIVLNTMTWFKAGAHDRIFNGMLAGAAVVTDDSSYLRQEFSDGKELSMFSLPQLCTLPERVFDLFGHMQAAQRMADCGYEAAKERHTWKSRAEYLAESFF